ncbi:hypothetical protein Lwal_3271 [Legionella waltersii]|uniref:Transmembrane protein n=1 Tax=Legionella waltersii TaxID=66969 RepID=A0A0W1A1J6_9GAMM|nr:hypothetical protein Lwal_3271 [Legionella waltersii]SNU96095.1 Uncharacterised protein [Legionella waltersii]
MTSLLSSHSLLILLGILFFMGIILITLAKGSSGHKMNFITRLGFYLALVSSLIFAIVLFLDVLPLFLK